MISLRTRMLCIGIGAFLTVTTIATAWQFDQSATTAPIQKGVAVSIVGQINFSVDRTLVWSTLTTMKGMQTISNFTIDPADGEKTFSTAGESVGAQIWNDKGRLMATLLDPRHELRVVFEPESAGYLCARRFVLATAGEGCVLQYWMQYTDFKPNADDTANTARADATRAAAEFRTLVGSRVKPATAPQ